jgi:hypothetical protein
MPDMKVPESPQQPKKTEISNFAKDAIKNNIAFQKRQQEALNEKAEQKSNLDGQNALEENPITRIKKQKEVIQTGKRRELSPDAVRVAVPSLGIFYGEDCEDGIFYIRPMKVKEEKILSTARLVKSGEAIDRILDSCIDSPNIPSSKLLLSDKGFLIITLRRISYGDIYEFGMKCQSCEEKYTDSVDLKTLRVAYLDENIVDSDLEVTLPKSGHIIRYRLLTSKDEEIITRKQKQKRKVTNAHDYIDDTLIDRLILSTVCVDGDNLDEKNLYDFYENLSVIDSEALRDEIQEKSIGIDLEIISECPNCYAENQIILPIDENFFRHTRRKTAN